MASWETKLGSQIIFWESKLGSHGKPSWETKLGTQTGNPNKMERPPTNPATWKQNWEAMGGHAMLGSQAAMQKLSLWRRQLFSNTGRQRWGIVASQAGHSKKISGPEPARLNCWRSSQKAIGSQAGKRSRGPTKNYWGATHF